MTNPRDTTPIDAIAEDWVKTLVELVRLDGRDPIFSVAISAIGVIARKKSLKVGVS